jgi:hypothetical protein
VPALVSRRGSAHLDPKEVTMARKVMTEDPSAVDPAVTEVAEVATTPEEVVEVAEVATTPEEVAEVPAPEPGKQYVARVAFSAMVGSQLCTFAAGTEIDAMAGALLAHGGAPIDVV